MIRWYIGQQDYAVELFRRDLEEGQKHGFRVSSAIWLGDRLLVTYDRTSPAAISVSRALGGIGASLVFGFAGLTMIGLRSVSGDSLAEAFYQAFGLLAFAMIPLSLGWGFAES